jgi:hypothetical protein
MAICKLTKAKQKELDELVGKYDSARGELLDWLVDVQSDWEAAVEEKSEKWRQGAGAEAVSRLDTLQTWVEELPEDCPIDAERLA